MEFTFGIEEEFFVVSGGSSEIEPTAHDGFIRRARELAQGTVSRELLQSQIEIATPVCHGIAEARDRLVGLRAALGRAGKEFGLAIVASGTHPTADWSQQVKTDKERYDSVVAELQMLAMRNLVCGMHVHVGLPDDELRIEIMRRSLPFLPVLLALSCSSPFWRGMNTGFSSYRMTSYDEMPRTGLPPLFASWGEYRGYIDVLCSAGIIRDESYAWWAIRPSGAHPTLELRIPDTCTSLEDAITIAAMYRCLVRALVMDRSVQARIRSPERALAIENKWRAQRFGLRAEIIDPFQDRVALDMATVVRKLVSWLRPHAAALDCVAEIERAEIILDRGNSADRQVSLFETALAQGASSQAAMEQVTGWLQSETLAGC